MSILSKAFKQASGQVQNAWDDTQDEANRAADEAKKIGKRLLNGLEEGWAEVAQIFDLKTIGIRGLRWNERNILQRVYGSSLPRMNNLLILSLAGASGRPFTIPASFVSGVANLILPGSQTLLILLVALAAKRGECYFLFMGNKGFNDAVGGYPHDDRPGQTLVHEACHAWQGFQGAFTWGYIFDSTFNQCLKGQGAYDIPANPRDTWMAFGAEQQAQIVDTWFTNGEHSSDPYYPYIKSNVRPGRPYATTEF
jgi:hypothetical protein